jgi:hypothetical protein
MGVPAAPRGLETRIREKLADWCALLKRNADGGRAVLKELLVGPLRFTPEVDERRRRYRFTGAIALDRLVTGVIDLKTLTGAIGPEAHRDLAVPNRVGWEPQDREVAGAHGERWLASVGAEPRCTSLRDAVESASIV